MTDTFYRVHWSDCPAFSADNAWSALWGATRSEDGSQTECGACDGTGESAGESCEDCGGQGWEDCVPGYSCFADAEQLINYFAGPGMAPRGEPVIIFEGQQVDTGADGEPTAVPHRIIETLTWETFVARHQQEVAA